MAHAVGIYMGYQRTGVSIVRKYIFLSNILHTALADIIDYFVSAADKVASRMEHTTQRTTSGWVTSKKGFGAPSLRLCSRFPPSFFQFAYTPCPAGAAFPFNLLLYYPGAASPLLRTSVTKPRRDKLCKRAVFLFRNQGRNKFPAGPE
jgi:hypothetical protein